MGGATPHLQIQGGAAIKSSTSVEIGFQVTDDSMTLGAVGSMVLPTGGSIPSSASTADTAYGNLPGAIGIHDTGSAHSIFIRHADGDWTQILISGSSISAVYDALT